MYFIYDAAGKLVSMKLDGVRYDYIRNAQSDITGLMDMAGNKVVSYSYDSWGKLEAIEGSLKDSLGVKNPYRYRGYRYDTETGLYYLQSRYYNPEWGRFINVDALLGQTGELLGHNLFAYTKNNPINASDPNGFMTIEGAGVGGSSSNIRIISSNSSFSYKDSVKKGINAGAIDKTGEVVSGALIKERKVWQSLGTLSLGKYGSNLSKSASLGKKALGLVGTIGFTAWDVSNSLVKGEYVGAGIDILSAAAGFGAGYLIGLGGAALITAGAPAVLIGAVGFGVGVGVGVIIDKISSEIKDGYYGR